MSQAREGVTLAMIQAETAVLEAMAPLMARHGVQGVIGAMAVVAGGLVGVAHARGLLEGSLGQNLDTAAELMRHGLHERVRKLLGEASA